jgi:hypothetical protein
MQESSDATYATVQLLLNIEQIWIQYPRVSTIYTDPNSLLIGDSVEVNITDVSCVVEPPTSVLTLDHSHHILQSLQVKKGYR